jgi:hypothetical protein
MRPSFGKSQAGTSDKVRYNSRNKDFAGLRLGHDEGCAMHGDPTNIPTSHFDITDQMPLPLMQHICNMTSLSH